MNDRTEFTYMNKIRSCEVFIDKAPDPCFVFVILLDKELIALFGNEMTIKTDFEKQIPHSGSSGKLIELKQCVFDAIQGHPEFIAARQRLQKSGTQIG